MAYFPLSCKPESTAMTILAAIAWGLAVALLIAIVNLCIVATIKGKPDES
jgi:hypothetical protein